MAGLMGEVLVRAEGPGYERLLNAAARRGIHLWDVQRRAGMVTFRMRAQDYPALRPGARAANCRVSLAEKKGLYFRRKIVKLRAALFLGLAAALAAIILFSGRVWMIDVTGVPADTAARIASSLGRAGIVRGAAKNSLNLKPVEDAVMAEMPELTYLGLSYNGIALIADARLAVAPPDVYDPSARRDIVAAKEGMIERVTLYNGKINVRPGQIVRPGDVLVYGVTTDADGNAAQTSARADVWARVWVQGNAELALTQTARESTGGELRKTDVRFFSLWFSPPAKGVFETYRVVHRRARILGTLFFPAEVVQYTYIEEREVTTALSLDEAKEITSAAAEAAAARALPSDAAVVDKHVQFDIIEGNTVKATVYLETRQQIGVFR